MLPLQPPTRHIRPGYPARSQALADAASRRRLRCILAASALGLALGGCGNPAAPQPLMGRAGPTEPAPAQPQPLPGDAIAPQPAQPRPLAGKPAVPRPAPAEPGRLRGEAPAILPAEPQPMPGFMAIPPPPRDPA